MRLDTTLRFISVFLITILCLAGAATARDVEKGEQSYTITSDDGDVFTVVSDGPGLIVFDEDGETVVDLDLDGIFDDLDKVLDDLDFDIHIESENFAEMGEMISEMADEMADELEEVLEDLEVDLQFGKTNTIHLVTDDDEYFVDLDEIMEHLGSTLETAFSGLSENGSRAHRHHRSVVIDDDDFDEDELRDELADLQREVEKLRKQLRDATRDDDR